MKIFITGSNFYNYETFVVEKKKTEYGVVEILKGIIEGEEVCIIPRHGQNHKNLPNHINYLANFAAIQELSPECVISFSVCGVLNTDIPLGKPIIPKDFFFPENRLPDGSLCTIFQDNNKKKGHLIPTSHFFNDDIQSDLISACFLQDEKALEGNYIHANGPRFNSPMEVQYAKLVGGDMISQTCGPEIVMANELKIPFGMLCFGIDYANGISNTPTSPEELSSHLEKSTQVFKSVIEQMVQKNNSYLYKNFIYPI